MENRMGVLVDENVGGEWVGMHWWSRKRWKIGRQIEERTDIWMQRGGGERERDDEWEKKRVSWEELYELYVTTPTIVLSPSLHHSVLPLPSTSPSCSLLLCLSSLSILPASLLYHLNPHCISFRLSFHHPIVPLFALLLFCQPHSVSLSLPFSFLFPIPFLSPVILFYLPTPRLSPFLPSCNLTPIYCNFSSLLMPGFYIASLSSPS